MTKFKHGDRVLVTARFYEEDVEMINEPCKIVSTKDGYHTIIADSYDYKGMWTVLDYECEDVQ